MRVLVLGATGMLGHKLMQMLPEKHEVFGTLRGSIESVEQYKILNRDCLIGGVDINDFDKIIQVVSQVQPQFIINCVGIIKQLKAANNPLVAIGINSLLPHKLANLSRACGARLIHISTDCVFSGNKGMYKETDIPDATDLYGRSKLLGEVSGPNCLTLRTSIIGRELESQNGLIEWFLKMDQKEVRGFRKAIYTGLTTIELSRILQRIMESPFNLTGVYQVSSDPINKHELLLLVQRAFCLSTIISPTDTPAIDRSLDSTRFRHEMNYTPPAWESMINEMVADKTAYSRWKISGKLNHVQPSQKIE